MFPDNTSKEYTFSTLPVVIPKKGTLAYLSDFKVIAASDGLKWVLPPYITLANTAKGHIVASLAAANAATYSQSGTLITVTSTGHGIDNIINNGSDFYFNAGTAATGATITPGWFTNFQYIDANTFTIVSPLSQTGTGAVNTNASEIVVTPLSTVIPAGMFEVGNTIETSVTLSSSATAGIKRFRMFYGTGMYTYVPFGTGSPASVYLSRRSFSNRRTDFQISQDINSYISGASVNPVLYFSVDSTVNQECKVSLQCDSANDYVAVTELTKALIK